MDTMKFLLWLAAALAAVAAWSGVRAVLVAGGKFKWTLPLMLLSFIAQLAVLSLRGEQRGSCPLADAGEILIFLGWSLSLFYLVVGSTYRVSLLGVFTTPVITILLVFSTLPGLLDPFPIRRVVSDYWWEMHTALSVLSYGGLALGAVAAVMFLVLNGYLKKGEVSSGLFKNMPPISTLMASMARLTLAGVIFLTIGLICGFMMARPGGAHLCIAGTVWVGYLILLGVWYTRGISPKRMAWLIISFFAASLTVFGAL